MYSFKSFRKRKQLLTFRPSRSLSLRKTRHVFDLSPYFDTHFMTKI